MNFILFDDERYFNFLPLTHTRPVSEIRCGILTMKEKWAFHLSASVSYRCADHLREIFPIDLSNDNFFVNSGIFPDVNIFSAILELQQGEALYYNHVLLAVRLNHEDAKKFDILRIKTNMQERQYTGPIKFLNQLWEIFTYNFEEIETDFKRVTSGRKSQDIHHQNNLICPENIFVDKGASVSASILNASDGPIYIGPHAEIMEGAIIRGPFALGEKGVIKMGAKIYGGTTIGPGCKVGGEVNNSVFFANSNKAHDGFVGNAIIGEWCNLGADTNNSNLKNNYAPVKIWNENQKKFVSTGLQFCGLIMADHSKCGINTMFNTGTVVGVSCNIFGGGFPRNMIPSFSWGGSSGMTEYKLEKAMETIQAVFARRNRELTPSEINLYTHIFNQTAEQRR